MTMLRDYQHDLIEDLRDPREAAEYLNAALEDGDSTVVANALRNVIEALAMPVHGEEAETLCRLKDYLGTAGLRLTISPR